MLKGKLKIPEKALKVFPDRLGSLVKGFDDHRDAGGGDGLETASFDLGEELETFHPNGFVSDREERDAEKKMAEEELEIKQVFERKLWNGSYFNYDSGSSSNSKSIQTDQLASRILKKFLSRRKVPSVDPSDS